MGLTIRRCTTTNTEENMAYIQERKKLTIECKSGLDCDLKFEPLSECVRESPQIAYRKPDTD